MNAERIKEVADKLEQCADSVKTNADLFIATMLEITLELYKGGDESLKDMLNDPDIEEAKDILRIFKAINKASKSAVVLAEMATTEGFNEIMGLVDDLEKELKEENNNEQSVSDSSNNRQGKTLLLQHLPAARRHEREEKVQRDPADP